jgi:hypothetical protein
MISVQEHIELQFREGRVASTTEEREESGVGGRANGCSQIRATAMRADPVPFSP